MVDEPRRRCPTPDESSLGEQGAAMVAAQQRDENVGSGAIATRRGDGEPFRLEHWPVGDDPLPRLDGADRQWRAIVVVRRHQAGGGWQRLRSASLGDHRGGDGSEQATLGSWSQRVGDRVGQRPDGELRWVTAVRAEQAHRDEFTPRVADGAHQAALTKLGSARGPMSIDRSSRNTVSGTTPRGVHSNATVTGRPPDAASNVATASLRIDSVAMGREPW